MVIEYSGLGSYADVALKSSLDYFMINHQQFYHNIWGLLTANYLSDITDGGVLLDLPCVADMPDVEVEFEAFGHQFPSETLDKS